MIGINPSELLGKDLDVVHDYLCRQAANVAARSNVDQWVRGDTILWYVNLLNGGGGDNEDAYSLIQVYGDAYDWGENMYGVTRQTLYNAASVCRAYPYNKRRSAIPFYIHSLNRGYSDYASDEEKCREFIFTQWLELSTMKDLTLAEKRERLRHFIKKIKDGAKATASLATGLQIAAARTHRERTSHFVVIAEAPEYLAVQGADEHQVDISTDLNAYRQFLVDNAIKQARAEIEDYVKKFVCNPNQALHAQIGLTVYEPVLDN